MTSSFLCENCGIKVSGAEGTQCPGCGQSRSSSISGQSPDVSERFSNFSDRNSIVPKKDFDSTWFDSLVKECEPLWEGNSSPAEFQKNLVELVRILKSRSMEAPDVESSNRLYSFLSSVFREQGSFKESYASGLIGVESKAQFFEHQAMNSILASITALDMHDEFQKWIERAKTANVPHADYHAMCYMTKNKRYDEALEACENYYTFDLDQLLFNRADILRAANRIEESELNYLKLIARGPKGSFFPNAINSLAWSIMMPQGRYAESEKLLASAICTSHEREKVNAFSNLAMVAFNLKEFAAAKRYATVGSKSNDLAIASESRLTLCKIEFQRLLESKNPTENEWESLFDQIILSLEDVDFDDASQFLEILLKTYEKSPKNIDIVKVIETQYSRLMEHPDRATNEQVAKEIEILRIQILSQNYLKESKYLLLDELFVGALQKLKDHNLTELIEYLRTPFAGIEIRRGALQVKNLDFLSDWAAFEQVPEILYALSKSETESVLVSLAENPASPDEVCMLISSKVDLDLDFALSARSNLSTRMIETLAKSPFDSVRKSIAERNDLADSVYTQLATDSSLLVRDAIKENESCSPEIKALAALGSL